MRVDFPSDEDVQREVHVWSENVSDPTVLDLLAAVERRVHRLDRDHDIPYVAGYSKDGSTIYIDRHMPKSFALGHKRIRTDRFLVIHEMIEKALLDQLGLHYLHAHQVALRTEQAAVRAAGVSWRAYDRFTKANEKKIEPERLTRVPRDLDLTPYRDCEDFAELAKMVAAETHEV
jgi:hypothetical protein